MEREPRCQDHKEFDRVAIQALLVHLPRVLVEITADFGLSWSCCLLAIPRWWTTASIEFIQGLVSRWSRHVCLITWIRRGPDPDAKLGLFVSRMCDAMTTMPGSASGRLPRVFVSDNSPDVSVSVLLGALAQQLGIPWVVYPSSAPGEFVALPADGSNSSEAPHLRELLTSQWNLTMRIRLPHIHAWKN